MRRLFQGLTALVGLVVLTIGVPLLLARVAGWPLPTKVPNWSNVYWSVRQQHIPAAFVVKTIAVVAWVAWAQLMWAVLWELVVNVPRQLRGQRSLAAPAAWNPMARLARVLVAPLMLLSTLGASSPAAAAPSLAHLSASAWSGVGGSTQAASAMLVDLSTPAERSPVWVVRAGDTLWDVAEQCLGDGSQVDRVLECNPGMVATRRLRAGDTITLPGDAVVPADRAAPAAPAESAEADAAAAAATTYAVVPGDTLWAIADEQLGDPLRWPEVFDLNEGHTFDDGRTLTDPDLIQPGWELSLPTEAATDTDASAAPSDDSGDVDAAAETGHQAVDEADDSGSGVEADGDLAEAPATSVGSAPSDDATVGTSTGEPTAPAGRASAPGWRVDAGREGAPPPMPAAVNEWHTAAVEGPLGTAPGSTAPAVSPAADENASDEGAVDEAAELVTLPRAAMLASGALLLLGVRRRRALRAAPLRPLLRPAPQPEPTPDPPVGGAPPAVTDAMVAAPAATERALRTVAADERFARVDLAVRAAALGLIAHRQRVLAVLAGPDGSLELVPTGPVDLAAPWRRRGERWLLPAEVALDDLAPEARRVATPAPALVQLGVDGDRDVYVDLEALGALEIDAPAAEGAAIARAVAATLATSVLAEVATLVGVAVPDAAFCDHRHHVSADTPTDGVAAAVDAVGSTAFAESSTFELRARATGGEAWEPAVLVVGPDAGDVPLPRRTPGVAVVSAAPIVGPSSVLAPDGDAWVLRPSGVRFVPIGLTDGELTAVADLLDVPDVGEAPEGPAFDDDRDLTQWPDDFTLAVTAGSEPGLEDTQPYGLLVRVLGPVRVEAPDGGLIDFERSKTRELVAWLATHRERATRTLARTALWELDVRDATFSNVVSEARRALARGVEPPPGEEWVGRTLTEELPLHPLVRTDAELLAEALDRSRPLAPRQAIAVLDPAVALLEGMPFEGTSYLWPDPEGLTSHLVLLATAAAAELAERYLSVDDVEGVFRATDRGLRVLPGHEELIGLRMQAHARVGDHAGVRLEWDTYQRTLLADPWSDGEPAPKLVALRAELLGPAAA